MDDQAENLFCPVVCTPLGFYKSLNLTQTFDRLLVESTVSYLSISVTIFSSNKVHLSWGHNGRLEVGYKGRERVTFVQIGNCNLQADFGTGFQSEMVLHKAVKIDFSIYILVDNFLTRPICPYETVYTSADVFNG